jgi:hypothetical protein
MAELDLSGLPEPDPRAIPSTKNEQTLDVFTAELRRIEQNAKPVVWRRPSDHDPDRLRDPLESVVVAETMAEHPDVVGAVLGLILHKLMEELLIGEVPEHIESVEARAEVLLSQLIGSVDGE